MYLCPLSIIILLYFFLLYLFLAAGNSLALYYPPDDIAVNCGSSGSSTAVDGRQWIGDIGSKYTISPGFKGKLISSKAIGLPLFPDPAPYMTARISRWQFTYTFQVTPGQKFVRLHFYPTSYPGFKRSKAVFTVKAGPFTLLSNFSASLTADALGLQSFAKEFCMNVEENQPLTITFSPSPGGTSDEEVYAFVNGIEIVSVPTGLYHTPEGGPGAQVVGKKYPFSIDKSIALETVQRLNVGGSSISSIEDTGMFREWSEDSNYLLESSVLPVTTTIRIKYTDIPTYSAPQKVYQTSWSTIPDKQAKKTLNFTWKLPVDMGFRYLVRFHFCELEYEITESGHMEFSIFINNQMAEAKADLIEWSGGSGVAVYRDYLVVMEGDRMEGKRDLLIALCPHNSHDDYEHTDAILKGMEVFKLSNPDNNLAGVNPVSLAHATTSSNPNAERLVFARGGNAIATVVVILIAILNIIVYQLRIFGENLGQKDISSLPFEGLCRHFSLSEVQSVTNNFDDQLVIGRGGFGKVYKGLIDGGETTVAIKRLNSKSKQGANEFWTEIEMLSKLRHRHLVSLIGYCNEFQEMILVYDYMEHGTLADHLYKINSNGNDNICHLSWEQRLKICIGAARGLDYLHTGSWHGIIHRDVKTTNILLDKNWVAKISDFGLCKMVTTSHSRTHVSTDVKGTFGYLDPEYFLTRRLTKKSDVYAFGVVLLEVLCGRPAVDIRLEEEQRSLAQWAQHCIKEGKLEQIVDPSLRDKISSHCLKVFAEVANKCLHKHPNGRPTMADVVSSLECGLASQDQSGGSSTQEEENVVNVNENIQPDAGLPQVTVPFASTLVQHDENKSQGKKRSKGKLSKVIQKSISLLAKSIDIRWRKRKEHEYSNSGQLQRDSGATQLYRRFSVAEIQAATNNFHYNLVIGGGDFSKVYKGWIDHGTLEVAIKIVKQSASDDSYTLRAENEAQSQLCHHHILSIIGFCEDEGKLMVVYNYMVNGSLQSHLYGRDSGYIPLPWKKRLEICIGAARGLQYLLSGTRHTIVHGNIKPTKILLDENWVAKVSGFELSKEVPNISTTLTPGVRGTLGYLDPEYIHHLVLTEKSDSYSFGVVLLEVLCARKVWDISLNEDQMHLVRWFRTNVRRKTIDQIIDPYLVGRIAPECLTQFVKIAWNCLLDGGTERPSMDDVVESLQIALELQQIWHNDVEVGGETHNDPVEAWFRSAVARAYNNVLAYDSAFDITDDGFIGLTSLPRAHDVALLYDSLSALPGLELSGPR